MWTWLNAADPGYKAGNQSSVARHSIIGIGIDNRYKSSDWP